MYNPANKYTDRLLMDNSMVLTKLSQHLSMTPDFIDSHMIEEMSLGSSCKMQEYSFALLLASSLSLDIEEKYEDAFEYAAKSMRDGKFDLVFTDL